MANLSIQSNKKDTGEEVVGVRRLRRILREHEVDIHRFLDCIYYDGCLTKAANENWKSFSCKECRVREVAK